MTRLYKLLSVGLAWPQNVQEPFRHMTICSGFLHTVRLLAHGSSFVQPVVPRIRDTWTVHPLPVSWLAADLIQTLPVARWAFPGRLHSDSLCFADNCFWICASFPAGGSFLHPVQNFRPLDPRIGFCDCFTPTAKTSTVF